MTLPEIIAALEAADGPSRELDIAIQDLLPERVLTTQPDPWSYVVRIGDAWHPTVRWPRGYITTGDRYVPRYTASLDAALTLVPEGAGWIVGANHEHHATVSTYPAGIDCRPLHYAAHGSNAAIALCIAALKAQAKDMT